MKFCVAGAVALAVCPAAEMAGPEICNETGVGQSVSVGYKKGDDRVSEGGVRAAANS